MKRSKKLLVLACALVVFVAAYFITSLVVKKADEKAAVVETEGTFALCEFTAEDIQTLTWTYNDEFYSVSRTEDGWQLDDEPEFKLNSETVESMAAALVAATADRKLEGGLEASAYGLDEPSCVVHAILKDGTDNTFTQGDLNSVTSEYYLDVNGTLYAVTGGVKSSFGKGRETLYTFDEVPDLTNMNSLTITMGENSYTIVKLDDVTDTDYSLNHSYFEVSGETAIPLDAETTATLYEEVASFAFANMYDYDATEEELNDTYGFGSPTGVITMGYVVTGTSESGEVLSETRSFTAEIGGAYSSYYYYVRLPGSNIVYRMNDDIGDLLLEFDMNNYFDPTVLGISGLSSFTMNYGGETYNLGFTIVEETKTSTDEDGNEVSTTDKIAVYAIEDISLTEDEYLAVTGGLTGLTATALAEESEAGDELISFTVPTNNENFPEVTVSFRECDAESYICVRSDGICMKMDASGVDSLIRTVKSYLKK